MMYFIWLAAAVFCGHLAAYLIQEAMSPYFAARRARKRLAAERKFFMQLGDIDDETLDAKWVN